MKVKFSIESPMPPIWMMYPNISRYSIGWRMGYGEGYKYDLFDWLETISSKEGKQYQTMFPHPVFWRGHYEAYDFETDDEEIDEYEYELIQFWNKNGIAKYTKGKLIQNFNPNQGFVFFWKPEEDIINESCLSQWQNASFDVNIETYTCTEQYMMAEKAKLFKDINSEKLIMKSKDIGEIKSLGRKVKNFDQLIWDKVKYSIVLNGNYYKFTQNKEMRDFLLSTGDKILVEASPIDQIWGIGLDKENEKALNPITWNGKNILGFALMEVRDELRKIYKHYDKIDWSKLKNFSN